MKGGKFTIRGVANQVAEDKLEHGTHKHASYIPWAKKGFRRLHEDTLCSVKTISVPMNAYNAVDLDDIEDYVDWTKVGIQYGDKVYALSRADDIALLQSVTDCGVPIKNLPMASVDDVQTGISTDAYMPYWFTGWGNYADGFGAYSGTSLPYKGVFTYNSERNQLQFSSNFNVENIYLEYITDGSGCDGDTEVDSRVFDYLVLFTHYERIRNRTDVPIAEKQRMSEELFYEHQRVRKLINPMTKEDLVNSLRRGYRLTPHI